jgi:hypothetical protein
MSKLRWAKWFWADWSNDTALNLCSLAAQGLWMRLLCIAAQGEPYGCVTIKGRPPSIAELRSLCHDNPDDEGDPHRNGGRRFRSWLAELERHGVLQWVEIELVAASPARQYRVISASSLRHPSVTSNDAEKAAMRVICSPRMLADGHIYLARSSAAKASWKHKTNGRNPRDLHEQKPMENSLLHEDKCLLHTIEAEADAEGRR